MEGTVEKYKENLDVLVPCTEKLKVAQGHMCSIGKPAWGLVLPVTNPPRFACQKNTPPCQTPGPASCGNWFCASCGNWFCGGEISSMVTPSFDGLHLLIR